MENKYSRLQISIHWLVFLLVIAAYCAMEFRGFFPRSDRPLINMIHVDEWHLNSRADGRSSFVKAEIPNPADYT
ncbi:hypothetical protein I5Z76_02614 [Escherichia coli]